MIIFIYGDDTFRSSKKLQEIKDKFKTKVDRTGATITIMDGEDFDLPKLREQLLSPSLFTKQRLIILKNTLAHLVKHKKDQAELVELLDKDRDNTIIFWEDLSDKDVAKSIMKSELFKLLRNTKYAQEFKRLQYQHLEKWIREQVESLGGTIEPQVVKILITLVGNDLWRLDSEIQKLVLYAGEKKVTLSDVETFVEERLEEDIWQFTDALAREHQAAALKLLADQLRSGSSPLELLNRMIWQFRVYILVKSILESKVQTSSEIAKELGLHPYVVQKALPVVKKFTFEKLIGIYQRLAELDQGLKSNIASPEVLLDRFIISL